MTVTLVALEGLSVATVLPVISRQLGDLRLYGWVFSAFFLASLIGIAAVGNLADRIGLAAPLAGGLGLFALGLFVGGTATSMAVLVAGRCLQGLGAGAVPAAAYTAIGRGYPGPARPRMFAVLSTAWVVPGLIGPSLAALVARGPGWRWVFLGLIPVVAMAGALSVPGLQAVPRADPGGDPGDGRAPDSTTAEAGRTTAEAGRSAAQADGGAPELHAPMGMRSAVLVTAAAGVVLAGLDATSWVVAALLVAAGLGAGGPALRRVLPPGSLLARRGLPSAVGTRGLLTFAFFAADAYVPLTLTSVRHTSTAYGGLALTGSTMTWTAGAWVQTRLIGTRGPRWLVTSGIGLIIAGTALTASVLVTSVPVWVAPLGWSVAGLGMGMSYSPLSVTALDRAAPGGEGSASASVQLADVLGTALGTGVAGAAIAYGHRLGWAPSTGLAVAFGIGVAVGAVGLVAARRLPRRLSDPPRA